MHIIFESVLMLLTKNLLKLVHACQSDSLPNLAHFFETQCSWCAHTENNQIYCLFTVHVHGQ